MNRFCAIAALGCLALSTKVFAGGMPTLDLEVTAVPDDAELQAFQATRITLTFTNHGPDDAPTVATGTSFSQGFMSDSYVLLAVPETPPCIINYTDLLPPPPAPIFWSATVLPQPSSLPAGESVICVVGLYVHPLLAGTQVEVPFTSIAGLDDPNPDNNNPVVTLDVYRPLADLEAVIEVDRSEVEAGDAVRATLTLTNHGPEAVVATGIETDFILGDQALETIEIRAPIDIPPDAEVPPCFPLVDGDLSLWPPAVRWTSTVYIQPASLGVGETRSCVFDILVLPALDGRVHDVHFAVAGHIDDPDPTNSSPIVRLRVGQPVLPVPRQVPAASGLALALAVLGVLAIGLSTLRRNV